MSSSFFRAILLMSASFGATQAMAKPLHDFANVTLSPDGAHLATLEKNESEQPGTRVPNQIVLRNLPDGAPQLVGLPCAACEPTSPTWSQDGKHLAFIMREKGKQERRIEIVDSDGKNLKTLLSFNGSLQDLKYGSDGRLAVLAIEGAHRDPGALQAGAPQTGEIDAQQDEQRIATVAGDHLQWQSPADLYVYEYSWREGGAVGETPRFVGTAAPGNGDDHWWLAKLYGFSGEKADVLYAPPLSQQLGLPVVSPDGKTVAFVGGLMSDFGFFGGDAFQVDLTKPQAKPRNLTPGLKGTVTGLSWCDGKLIGAGLAGARSAFWNLSGNAPVQIAQSDDLISNGSGEPKLVCGKGRSVVVRQNFTKAPELAIGVPGAWTDLTHDNADQPAHAQARSVTWKSDGFTVQGWLLSPLSRKAGVEHDGKIAMITQVHGGPSSAVTPRYLKARSENERLLNAGYDLFLPNPRGSYGQGEAFTQANRRDFGHGDLRDLLRGIDAVERVEPVDDKRLGVTGYSYGGYMTMWTVTQTNRFKAAVAGGGVSNWQSYYGENGIDGWLPPFFGASVYDDPAVYAKSSPINFIKNVKTPTFIYVGANDEECPPPQSLEFYHALRTLNVPTSLVIYPGEGHGMREPKHQDDATARTIAWFDRYLNR
ncbi:S9 family peptidase [Kozakia baliensis]|uniref:S9 family peptidase n=1 Tax=Kozakia baliensis TaxID=153496 RepID=UPI00087CBA36|nr:S9 family peptidase [Kozakia baliensis]AOX20933.1 hypothetical protein A0U90_12305 [Kozakia baliensis]